MAEGEIISVILRHNFMKPIGQSYILNHLESTVEKGRIPHAQLFLGQCGSGLLQVAIAYAGHLICKDYEKNGREWQACLNKVEKLSHPDLHFVYPVNTTENITKNPISDNFSNEWRSFVFQNPYASQYEWLQLLGIEKKQGNISVNEAKDISKKLSLKSYEGGYKVMIIWMAEMMNLQCANKILKLLEEPPNKTVLLLLTENEDQILNTIRSRCQKTSFPKLSEHDIAMGLIQTLGLKANEATRFGKGANGDFQKAINLYGESGEHALYDTWFIDWVRTAFQAKGNKKAINYLLDWSEKVAAEGRETQKKFLAHCFEIFRQALLINYKSESFNYKIHGDFDLSKFAPFIHENNIYEISTALENAMNNVERNGNAKIIFTDLSISLTRYLHTPTLS